MIRRRRNGHVQRREVATVLSNGPGFRIAASILVVATTLATAQRSAYAAKSTECVKIGICYCVNDDLKTAIASKVERFRQLIAEQRKAGKAVGYLSVPLTSTGG